MRHALLLVFVLLSSVAPAASQTAPAGDAEATAVLDAFYAAMRRGDAAGAMNLIAPDAVFVEAGRLETRAEYEKNHLPADIGFEKQVGGKRLSTRATTQGDTAWVIAETEFVGTFDGKPVDFVSAQLAVLTRQAGAWRIRTIHWSSRRR